MKVGCDSDKVKAGGKFKGVVGVQREVDDVADRDHGTDRRVGDHRGGLLQSPEHGCCRAFRIVFRAGAHAAQQFAVCTGNVGVGAADGRDQRLAVCHLRLTRYVPASVSTDAIADRDDGRAATRKSRQHGGGGARVPGFRCSRAGDIASRRDRSHRAS